MNKLEETMEKRKQYARQYRRKNPGKNIQAIEKYWIKRIVNYPPPYLAKLLSELEKGKTG